MTATGPKPITTEFLNVHSTVWTNWPNDWTVLWVVICTVDLTVCCCHVAYALWSESSLYFFLNVKVLLGWNRRNIWSPRDCHGTRTHNHLVRKGTLNHMAKLAKWLRRVPSTYLYSAFDSMLLSCHLPISELMLTLFLPECQGTPCSKQARYLKYNWLQRD